MSPIFPHRCPDPACGYREDVWAASMLAGEVLKDHPPTCPRCGKKMERRPGNVAHAFKGQGWSKPSARVEEKSE